MTTSATERRQATPSRRKAATEAATPRIAVHLDLDLQRPCWSCGIPVDFLTPGEQRAALRAAAAAGGPPVHDGLDAVRMRVIGASGEFGVRPDPGWRDPVLGRLAASPLTASARPGRHPLDSAALALGTRVDHGPLLRRVLFGKNPTLTSAANRPLPSKVAEFVRCPSCMARHDRAERLARLSPRTLGRHGGDRAIAWTSNALDALAYLRQPEPYLHDGPDAEKRLEADLETLIANFRAGGVPFAANVVWDPATDDDGGWPVGTATPRPWAHVTPRSHKVARQAYADTLAQRMALTRPPVRIKAPLAGTGTLEGTACALCGIGEMELSALRALRAGGIRQAAGQVWDTLTTRPSALGARGRTSFRSRDLAVCLTCRKAVEREGGVGQSAMERALSDHLTATGQSGTDVGRALARRDSTLTGLKGWAALAADEFDAVATSRKPNPAPWAHVNLSIEPPPATSWAPPAGQV